MSTAERNGHPFNAQLGGWADPNLPVLFAKGQAGESGFVITVNQTNTRKATTYAPVPFGEGAYRDTGVFAVVAVGANMEEFHRAATTVAGAIDRERERLEVEMAGVVIVALALLALAGVVISRTMVRPLARLTAAARQLEKGTLDEAGLAAIRERRYADEVTVLAGVFTEMGRQVVRREQQLRTEIADLHIQIDSRRRQQQVDEITETDYFRNLRDTATRMRSRGKGEPVREGDPV
jgi:HAMP domain-containing protein